MKEHKTRLVCLSEIKAFFCNFQTQCIFLLRNIIWVASSIF